MSDFPPSLFCPHDTHNHLVCGLASSLVAGKTSVQQRKWLKAMEQRIDATKRLLDSLKSVKMRGAEDRVGKVVNELRRLEIRAARPFRALITVAVFLCKCATSSAFCVQIRCNS